MCLCLYLCCLCFFCGCGYDMVTFVVTEKTRLGFPSRIRAIVRARVIVEFQYKTPNLRFSWGKKSNLIRSVFALALLANSCMLTVEFNC